MPARAIGVFDSGVGGLSVLGEIRRLLPAEHLIYVADSGYAPYGDRTPRWIEARSIALVEFLARQNVKAVVVACNTATAAGISKLRATFAIPIIAIEPAVKPAAAQTRSGVIAVLATTRTLDSARFEHLRGQYGMDVEIVARPCPGLADRVEAGEVGTASTRAMIEGYLAPVLARGADTLVLGCTHYSFLATQIREVAGPDVAIIDPAPAVARQLRSRLLGAGLLRVQPGRGDERFYTSGSLLRAREVIATLWGSGGPTSIVDVLPAPPRWR